MCKSINNGTFGTPENVKKVGVTWLVGFTQILHEDAGPASRGQNESPFSTSRGTVTRTGRLTQGKYSLSMDALSASYS